MHNNPDCQDVLTECSVHVCMCVHIEIHTQNSRGYLMCISCKPCLHFDVHCNLCVPPFVCLCTRISVFAHSCPSKSMNNKLYFDMPLRWTWESASFDSLAFDMAASQHQRLDETRAAAALRGSSLTLPFLLPFLPPSPYFSVLSCSFCSFFCSLLPASAR